MQPSHSANGPAQSSSRLPQVDMLRGLALVGIGIENIFAIHTPNHAFAEYAAHYPEGANHWLLVGLMVVLRSKFYPIFSLVFGIAAAFSIPKNGTAYFLRRLGVLLVLGILQVVFVWNGDVLVHYAGMGLLLLLCRSWPGKWLVVTSGSLLAFSFLGHAWLPTEAEPALSSGAEYGSVTYFEAMQGRLLEYKQSIFSGPALLFYARIFAFMLLGFALVKGKFLQKLIQLPVAAKAFGIHAGLVVALGGLFVLAGWRQEGNASVGWLRDLLLALYFYALVACWSLLPFLLKSVFSSLKWLGQLTLTHYLLQNLIFSVLMFGYGFGLGGQLSPLQLAGLYAVLIVVQWGLSRLWLRHFKLGPVEALLRKVAGWKAQKAPHSA